MSITIFKSATQIKNIKGNVWRQLKKYRSIEWIVDDIGDNRKTHIHTNTHPYTNTFTQQTKAVKSKIAKRLKASQEVIVVQCIMTHDDEWLSLASVIGKEPQFAEAYPFLTTLTAVERSQWSSAIIRLKSLWNMQIMKRIGRLSWHWLSLWGTCVINNIKFSSCN